MSEGWNPSLRGHPMVNPYWIPTFVGMTVVMSCRQPCARETEIQSSQHTPHAAAGTYEALWRAVDAVGDIAD